MVPAKPSRNPKDSILHFNIVSRYYEDSLQCHSLCKKRSRAYSFEAGAFVFWLMHGNSRSWCVSKLRAVCFGLTSNYLVDCALGGFLFRTPAEKFGSMAETVSGEVVVLELTD